jgi:hydroxymethylglutaryl-CoA lyase
MGKRRQVKEKTGHPAQVKVVEVGPRDGLQNVKETIPTESKIAYIEKLVRAGCRYIEVTSFVHPKWVPQLADSREVYGQLPRKEDVHYIALVPNVKGMEAALELGVQEIAVFTSASESFSQKNANASVAESLQRCREVADMGRRNGIPFRGYISTSFGCPFEGPISPNRVVEITDELFDMGVYEVSLGDTVGVAVPTDVERLLSRILERFGPDGIALHMHDTRHTALANILRGLDLGVATFDASSGGLGGCPFAPGASGNLATEDLVYMLRKMGITTNIDLMRLGEATRFIEEVIGRPLLSHIECRAEITQS